MVDAETSFPAHRILDDLRGVILAGGLAPGERLPSEHDLVERYGTSRPTVRRAIARLKAEGLIVTEQGRGAFVRPTPHARLLLTGAIYRKHRGLGLVNAQPVALCDSFYPAGLTSGTVLAESRRIRGGAHAVIEDPDGPDRPLEVQDTVAAADRHAFRYEVPMVDERTPARR